MGDFTNLSAADAKQLLADLSTLMKNAEANDDHVASLRLTFNGRFYKAVVNMTDYPNSFILRMVKH